MNKDSAYTRLRQFYSCFIFLSLMVFIFTSCNKNKDDLAHQYSQIKPKLPTPSWGPTLTPQMQTVIETLDTISPVPLHTLTPQQARMQPTPADAAMQVMRNYNIPIPPMLVDTMGVEIPVEEGLSIHARIYTPKTGKSIYPVIVYYHGGGWVIATIDTYNASAQALAELTDAIVVSVEYRKGPEYKFPTAHNDAFTAYKWTLQNIASMKGDASRVAVAGESAGGNMALTVSIMARDNGIQKPLHIVSIYPVANNDLNSPSYQQYAMAKPLNKPLIEWFLKHYLNNPAESADTRLSLVNADLSGLPATTIIAAEIDPLQSEGKLLAGKLDAAGVPVKYQLYKGVTHEFFGMATVIPEAKKAQQLASSRLKMAFQ